jgi:hypothetical protein
MSSRTSVTVVSRPTTRQEKAYVFLTEFLVHRSFPGPEIPAEMESHDPPTPSLGCCSER